MHSHPSQLPPPSPSPIPPTPTYTSPTPTPPTTITSLPSEILTQIFDAASDEDIIFQPGLCTSLAESVWYKSKLFSTNINEGGSRGDGRERWSGEWRLRSPQEAMNMIQRRAGVTKLSIILTCKQWNTTGAQFLYRCLHFSSPHKMVSLARHLTATLQSSPTSTITRTHGWWTRRIHIARYTTPSTSITVSEMEHALITIINHCPNLDILVAERPLGSAFGPVISTIATVSTLRTLHCAIPGEALKKILLAFASLPNLTNAFVDFSTPVNSTQEIAYLGASNISLKMAELEQLQLRGYMAEFIDIASGWEMPKLRAVTMDGGTVRDRESVGDVVAFLETHGQGLVFLDMNFEQGVDVARVLEVCAGLRTFCFNVDWRLATQPQVQAQMGMPMGGYGGYATISTLTKMPHRSITTIGLHGLTHAFGVGVVGSTQHLHPLTSRLIVESNERNIASLTKRNFEVLERVRVLGRGLL
ncbi:hypothetical protein CVT24_007374, partial [Panaeolus cyanescens]